MGKMAAGLADYVYGSSPYNQKMRRLSSSGLQRRTRTYQSRPSYSRTLPDALSDTLPPAAHPWMPPRPWPAVRFMQLHIHTVDQHKRTVSPPVQLHGCRDALQIRATPSNPPPAISTATGFPGSPWNQDPLVPFPCRDHALPHPPHKAR